MTSAATAAALCMILGGAAAVPAAAAGKVKVFIMMGQSNMLGEGRIGSASQNTNGTLYYAVNTEHKYPYLWDTASKNWTTSKSVRNVFVMGSGGPSKPPSVGAVQTNSFMNGGEGHRGSIGPELGIGGAEGLSQLGEPVMMLKSAIGNRALGWDLLPPGSKQRDFTDPKTKKVYTYAGYGQSPEKWEKGTTPKPIAWTAGIQYDGDLSRADLVLKDFPTYYPGASGYEVAGFFWWQGDRDSRDAGLTSFYESNLEQLIAQLRLRYKVPNAPFVAASLGQSTLAPTCTGNCGGGILQAMLNVAKKVKNVATIDSHPLSMGSSSGSHYGKNAETYMNVGQAMGAAMVKLLKAQEAH